MDKIFAGDILKGLTSNPKYLPSKYFYDEKGDEIFQRIMQMEEYYLTASEYEILTMNKQKFLDIFHNDSARFYLIELGAGDGFKTKVLLRHFCANEANFKYLPVDISENVCNLLENGLKKEFDNLDFRTINDDYFNFLDELKRHDSHRKVIMFMGSNIGNFRDDRAVEFLSRISKDMNEGDLLMVGFDLKKDPEKILNAYNDRYGITASFNLNLLDRINAELDGDFDTTAFTHYPVYDPDTGDCKSYLISQKKQEVQLKAIDENIEFGLWESIFMEVSKKYDIPGIEKIGDDAGLKVVEHFFDCKHYFVDTLYTVK